MPNRWTFLIKPIAAMLVEEVQTGLWIDPFAGKNSPAGVKNDLNPAMEADHHLDAIDFLKLFADASVDGVLLDPPYSTRQVSEHYKSVGMEVTGWHTSAGWSAAIKDEVARVLKPNGKAICFGWNSMGLGLKRGFTMERILLVPHGGAHNDTICTVELKHGPKEYK